MRKIVPALSIAAGTIHLLLIQDHMAEAFEWGVFFTVVGASQIAYGFTFVKFQRPFLHYLGAIGNLAILVIYVHARLFIPPFAQEPTAVTEIDAAGIITDIIEATIIILLLCSLRFLKLEGKIKNRVR